MSTQTPFDSAFDALKDDGAARKALIEQLEADQTAYDAKMAISRGEFADNIMLLYYLLTQCFASSNPEDHSNIFGIEDENIGITGKSLRAMGDVGLLSNAIQNITTGDGTLQEGLSDIASVASDCDNLLDLLGAGDPSKANQDVINALGPQAVSSLVTNLEAVRATIYSQNAETWTDPTTGETKSHNPPAETEHFTDRTGALITDPSVTDPTDPLYDTGFIGSFADAKTLSGLPGDRAKVTETMETITNAFTSISQTAQTINASLNEEFSQMTSENKNVQAFYAAILKDMVDQMNAFVQNMTSIRG